MILFDADQDCSHVAAEAYQKGARGVARYLGRMTPAETDALHAAGLAIVLIWEHEQERALDGYAVGVNDGRLARAEAKALGAPVSAAVYATADFDVTPAQEGAVINYFRGFADACGSTGTYSNGAIAQKCDVQKIGRYRWVPDNRWRGSQGYIESGGAEIVQDDGDKAGLDLGIDIDTDTAVDGDIGAWMPLEPVVVEPQPPEVFYTIPTAKQMQHMLNVAGANPPLKEDGIWGPLSSAALMTHYRHQ